MMRPSSAIGRKPSIKQNENISQQPPSNKESKPKVQADENKQPKIVSKVGPQLNTKPNILKSKDDIKLKSSTQSSNITKTTAIKPVHTASMTKISQQQDINITQKAAVQQKQQELDIDQSIQQKIVKKNLQENNTIEEDVRIFKNQRSKLLQWYYANLKLEHSFAQQQDLAREEIFDRFMQHYDLKQENFELQRLIQNHTKISLIDDSLNIQYDTLTDITQQWPLFVQNMDYLGQKLERSLNHLPLGCDTIIEDSELMQEQISEINNQMLRSTHLMQSNHSFNKEIQEKLEELQTIINVECEQLNMLQKLTQKKQMESLQKNSERIEQIIDQRDEDTEVLALTNTFL